MPFAFVLFFQLLIISIVISIGIYGAKRTGAALKRLADAFGVKLPKFSLYQSLDATYNGRNFRAVLIPQGKNSPAYLQVHFFKETFIKLKIYRESFFSEAGKKIGLVREVKTGDSIFDSEFLIFCDQPDQAPVIFYDSQFKANIRDLFGMGFSTFICDRKKIFISKPNYSVEYDLEPGQFKKILERLDYIAKRL